MKKEKLYTLDEARKLSREFMLEQAEILRKELEEDNKKFLKQKNLVNV